MAWISTRSSPVTVLDHGRRKISQSLVDPQTGIVAYPVFDPVMIDN